MTARVTPEPGARPVVVLISVTWAGPSRPAPTVLRELSRRWGREIRAVLLEDPDDEVLDQLEIELVPTWVRLEAPHSDAVPRPGTVRDLEISGTGLDGQGLFLTGAWLETHRRTGALPKHVIDTEFGPRGL